MNLSKKQIYWLLGGLTVIASLLSLKFGAVHISSGEIFSALQKKITGAGSLTQNERIFFDIRFPRAVLTLLVGASLAVGGVLMQGLFLNPIVEPGLIGTSSGAAFGAALYFTFSAQLSFDIGMWTLPVAACSGGMISTYLVFFLSQRSSQKRTSTVTLLLVGIAINAIFMSGVGFLSYLANDPQARSITFWNLGTLSGASWQSVSVVAISTVLCIGLGLRYAKKLNALMLGESEAENIGINVWNLKLKVLTINVIMVAVATAFTGVIAFVGLIVPHLLRILKGSDNRYLIIGGVLMGGLLLMSSDVLSRMLLAPAELPIGIVTTIVGAPVFIYLLRQNEYYF